MTVEEIRERVEKVHRAEKGDWTVAGELRTELYEAFLEELVQCNLRMGPDLVKDMAMEVLKCRESE